MSRQALEQKIEELNAARSAPDIVNRLRKALKDRNNYYVSKAAALIAELNLHELTPDLIAAFDRFLIDPVKNDPQCWAKNACVKVLKSLGHRGSPVFLRGVGHFQFEPVWGGKEDTAITLRGACGHALVDSELDDLDVLNYLIPLLADPAMPVRLDAIRAVGQLGRQEGGLLLRLKALCGDREPDVLGQCFASILELVAKDAPQFVARFLANEDEAMQEQAASALAESRRPEAVEILRKAWLGPLSLEVRRAIVISLGASPLNEAAEFLLSIIEENLSGLGAEAITVLSKSRFREELRARLDTLIDEAGTPRLRAAFKEEFNAPV